MARSSKWQEKATSKKTLKQKGLLKKAFYQKLQQVKESSFEGGGFSRADVYFMDESRFGLQTIARRVLSVKGIKPLLPYQHRFENFYLFGAYSPISGHHFTLELPTCNRENFQLYLKQFSTQRSQQLKIIILDNGAFHKAKHLVIPPNIVLLFLPPYCPELNGAEKIWRHLKDTLANQVFSSLDNLSDQLVMRVNQLKPTIIKSLTAFNYCIAAFNACFL